MNQSRAEAKHAEQHRGSSRDVPRVSGTVAVRNASPGRLVVEFSGDWTLASAVQEIDDAADALASGGVVMLDLRVAALEDWDSRLLARMIRLGRKAEELGIDVETAALPADIRGMLTMARASPERADATRQSARMPLLGRFGESVLALWDDVIGSVGFVGETSLSLSRLVVGRARFRGVDFLLVLEECGARALPIVSVISLLVGLILAFVGAVQLQMFGAQVYIADLVGLGMAREMGALMTAIIVSGRTGAAFAAQLGTMNVNQEIDALKAMGIPTFDFLVLPRVLALVSMMPFLCLYSILMGIVGGAIVATLAFDISLSEFINETLRAVHIRHFMIGLTKGAVFGVLIAIAGCMRGLQSGRSASAVGAAATSAVVTSIVYIVVSDSIMTLILNRIRL